MSDEIEWPREIWMAEREEYDQGAVSAVLSEHATVARWEGDDERDREFHRYIDADIYDSAEKYWRQRAEAAEAERDRLRAKNERLLLTLRNAKRDLHEIQAGDLSPYEVIEPIRAALEGGE